MLVSSEEAMLTVFAVVEVVKEQGTAVALRRQGAANAKSVVRLIASVLLAMVEVVRILMASCSLAETMLLEGVTEMMRWPCTIITSRPINIIILLQTSTENSP